jgi:hypothetical protein
VRRVFSAVIAVVFLPAGLWILRASFDIDDAPHVFVMFVFSGSLAALIGLCGLIGLTASGWRAGRREVSDDDQPPAAGGGDS